MRVWNQVYVLSVRPEFQQVTLGTWGNPEAGFGGFSDKPETCQVRRLLVMRDNITQLVRREASGPAEWELIKEQLKSLTCKINLPDDWDSARTVNHWIPNTAGGLGNIKIELAGTNAEEGQGASLPLDGFNIVFLPPADQFFDKLSQEIVATEKSNIAVNKGTGIEIWAEGIDTDGIKITDAAGKVSEYKLVTFSRKPFGDSDLKDDNPVYGGDNKKLGRAYYREPVFEAAYFDATGKGKNNYRLHTEDIAVTESGAGKSYKQCLVLEGNFGGQVRKLYRFKIKAIADASIRPGDDFLLRFGVVEAPGVAATANDGDFVAVYDHKMLWRANLYIDERKNEDGTWRVANARICDWGQLTQSKQDTLKKLDWNDLHPWDTADNEWKVSGTPVNGGQNEIKAWTRFTDDAQVYNSVAYTWGGADAPSDFDADMTDQRAALLAIKNYDDTISPTGKWDGYVFGTRNADGTYNAVVHNGKTYYPYTPGFSIKLKLGNAYTDIQHAYSAGTDCTGFIQRCVSYAGAAFQLSDFMIMARHLWNGTGAPDLKGMAIETEYSWSLEDYNKMIPGDVYFVPGHAMMILTVKYDNTVSRGVLPVNVIIIEAAAGQENTNLYRVMNHQTWKQYGGEELKKFMRLKMK